jgi:hypothetical protein
LHDTWPPVGTGERRASCRYAVAAARAWIGWWEDSQFRQVAADIEEVSLRGARLIVERFPPDGRPVWLHPPGGASDDWLEVRVVETKKRLFGPRQLRVAFCKALPYEVFQAVFSGPNAVGGAKPEDGVPGGQAREHDGR